MILSFTNKHREACGKWLGWNSRSSKQLRSHPNEIWEKRRVIEKKNSENACDVLKGFFKHKNSTERAAQSIVGKAKVLHP